MHPTSPSCAPTADSVSDCVRPIHTHHPSPFSSITALYPHPEQHLAHSGCSVNADWMNEWGRQPCSLPALALPSSLTPMNAQLQLASSSLPPTQILDTSMDWPPVGMYSSPPQGCLQDQASWAKQGRESRGILGKPDSIKQWYLLFPMINPETWEYCSKSSCPILGLYRLRPTPSDAPLINLKPSHAKPSVFSCPGNKNIPTAQHIQVNTPLITHLGSSPGLWKPLEQERRASNLGLSLVFHPSSCFSVLYLCLWSFVLLLSLRLKGIHGFAIIT